MVIKCLKISDDDKTDLGLAMMIKLTFSLGISDDDKVTFFIRISDDDKTHLELAIMIKVLFVLG